jgi:histone-lysine N-methyltransferase SETMAR
MELDRSQLRTIVYYCWKRNMNPPAICKEVNDVLGDHSISLRTCQNFVHNFLSGDFDVTDAPRSGRPSLDINDEIQKLLDEDPHHTCRSIAAELAISPQTALSHLREMGKRYMANCWIPHCLTEDNKTARIRACEELLEMHQRSQFVLQLVTMDEIWVYWDVENTGKHKKSWRGVEDPPVTHERPRVNRKHMLSVFWDSHGVLLMDVLPHNVNVNATYYCGLLDRLVVAIKEKRRRNPSSWRQYYHHDNARRSPDHDKIGRFETHCYSPTPLFPRSFPERLLSILAA